MDAVDNFPGSDCPYGYSWDLIQELLSRDDFIDFCHWMAGQTQTICDGRLYSHELGEYYPSPCADDPHGAVVYSWDFKRFLGFHGQAAKDLWD